MKKIILFLFLFNFINSEEKVCYKACTWEDKDYNNENDLESCEDNCSASDWENPNKDKKCVCRTLSCK